MNPFTDMNPEPNDLEYQRFGETRVYTIPQEFKLWVLSVVIFLIDVICLLGGLMSMFYAIVNHDSVYNPAIPMVATFIGLLLLGNGIFGQNMRGCCLTVYIFVFQIIPTALYSIIFVLSVIFFNSLVENFRKSFPAADAKLLAFYIMGCFLFFIFYRIVAVLIIQKYKRSERLRNPDF